MLFWKGKKNCWEFMECERGPGGAKAETLGLCPAALNKSTHRESGGKHTNHIHWNNKETAEVSEKEQLECLECDFFQFTMQEAGAPLKLRNPQKGHNSAIIRTRMTILALLSQSHQSNIQFDVSADENPECFQSSLIDINPETNVLTFNAPGIAAGQLCKNKNLRLSSIIQGSELRFTVTLFGAGEKDGAAFYMVKLPHFVYHPQIRRSYRISMNHEQPPFQVYYADHNQNLKGHIIDISIDGIGIMLQHQDSLTKGDILENCSFRLPSGEGIPASIEICNIHQTPQQDAMRIGGHFYDIAKENHQRLGQFINNAQRDKSEQTNS
jgi:c-di-GMP-binding flagellar brake protein YcgR